MSGSIAKELLTGYEWNPFLDNNERSVKALEDINKALDKHQDSLYNTRTENMSSGYRSPSYIPHPEIIIDTDSLADTQYGVADRLGGVMDSQRNLVRSTSVSNSLQKRMLSTQGMTNDILESIAHSGNQHAVKAYNQREEQLNELMRIGESSDRGNGLLSDINGNINQTRMALGGLLRDIGNEVVNLTNEQIVTRMGVLQALYKVQSTFLQSHENEMLAHQYTQNLLQDILIRSGNTEEEKQARKSWERAEILRKRGDFHGALFELKKAYELDDINPQILISSATIQSSLGNFYGASSLFAQAEEIASIKSPHSGSYILMNLASNLMELGRVDHAERVMMKAVRMDPS
ncbi:MAG: hypothetical protein Q8K26_04585, partial [Candidatus Gracilibacteria bacterium]|nr:hypothetical protein [Candidatus Gracilibacteria bacterium]